jgi:hypothetical protein
MLKMGFLIIQLKPAKCSIMCLKAVCLMYVNCVLNLVYLIDQLPIDQSRDHSLNQAVNQAEDIAQLGNQPAKWLNRLIDGRTVCT